MMADRQPDFATGKLVDLAKPEERVRQEYERVLVESYGYAKADLDIGVRIPRGTGHFPDEADIVVYSGADGRDPARDILGIVETKRKERTDGIGQLKSYMTATSARFGVWTNGEDIAFLYRDPASAQVLEDYLHNIPAKGQIVDDVGRLTKEDLRPFERQELKVAFRRILNTLYANTNISRREKLGGEMIKLIFCKIQDEKTFINQPPSFRVQPGEEHETVKNRIGLLFAGVLDELKHDGVFDPHETITLDARAVTWVVGQLERGSLLQTDTDVVGDAFEVFAESRLVGEKGEFFTPRSVVALAIDLINPRPSQTVCDPACGSGGFLIHAMTHIWEHMENDPKWSGSPRLPEQKREIATQTIFGIDKESDLVKIAKAYMAISGDGRSNVVHENTLHTITQFDPVAQQYFSDGERFRTFDIVVTNPPFGTKAKVRKEDSAHFALGKQWSKAKFDETWRSRPKVVERDPYVLFVERCLDMVRPGGVLGIVLPETVFHAPTLGYLRQHLLYGNSLRAVIDLPHNTFRPHCNAKTCMVILQKGVPQQETVLMAYAQEMGHDHNGRPLMRYGTDEIWDDLAVARRELSTPADPNNSVVFEVPWATIDPECLVPRVYAASDVAELLPQGAHGVSIGQLIDEGILDAFDGHGSPPATEKGRGNVPYIRVNDVVNWELYRNPIAMVPEHIFEEMTRNRRLLEEGDVVLVRRGSYRIGTVAMASARDSRTLLTRELVVFRVMKPQNQYGITQFNFLGLLASAFVQAQIPYKTLIDTTLPNLGARWKELVLPINNAEAMAEASASIERAIRKKWDAQNEIDDLEDLLGQTFVR